MQKFVVIPQNKTIWINSGFFGFSAEMRRIRRNIKAPRIQQCKGARERTRENFHNAHQMHHEKNFHLCNSNTHEHKFRLRLINVIVYCYFAIWINLDNALCFATMHCTHIIMVNFSIVAGCRLLWLLPFLFCFTFFSSNDSCVLNYFIWRNWFNWIHSTQQKKTEWIGLYTQSTC